MTESPPPPYGPGQPPYGAPQYGGPAYPVPDHPQATTVLVLGIVSIVVCGLAAPFAWVMGNRVVAEIDASGGRVGGRGNAQAGRVLGIVGTAILGVTLLGVVAIVFFALAGVATST